MNPDLIIFDCDGVLIDSEIIACRVDAEALTALGIPMSTEDVIGKFAGVSQADMRVIIESETGRALPHDHEANVAKRVRQAMSKELREIAGVRSTVEQIGIPFCIASSSTHKKLKFTLTHTGLFDLFEPNIFSSTEVPFGKPAPDLFLYAAGKMKAAPEKCVVVEDSTAGITAAVAAGMPPIGFVGGTHCDKRHTDRLQSAGAEIVINNFADLMGIIPTAFCSSVVMKG